MPQAPQTARGMAQRGLRARPRSRIMSRNHETRHRRFAAARSGEFGGHRDKAEELLNQAKGELEAAAEFANHHP